MKKLAIFLLLVAFPFVTSFKTASAAEDCTNIFLEGMNSFRDSIKTGYSNDKEADPNDTKPMDLTQQLGLITSTSGSNVNILLGGDMGKCKEAQASIEIFLTHKHTTGIVQAVGKVATVNAFLDAPSSNIGVHYANMLLPKEFINQGNTAYAANTDCDSSKFNILDPSTWGAIQKLGLTRPPMCESAGYYWNNDNLGLSKIWGASFALSMAIVVVILIISGFLIMFRSKMGGQVTVTVAMALQNVLLASVMALASFALGVFFVNLSKALTLLVANLVMTALWSTGSAAFVAAGAIGMGTTYLSDPFGLAVKLILVLFAGDIVSYLGNLGGVFSMSDGLAAFLGPVGNAVVELASGFIFNATQFLFAPLYILIRLIIIGAIIIVSIRIVWTVIKIYIKMLIDVAIAPVLFVVSAIPGRSNAVGEWLKRMFKNAIIPPLMFALVNIAVFVTLQMAVSLSAGSGTNIDPITAVTGGALPPSGFGLLTLGIAPHAIVFIILLNMVPTIPTIVEDMFSAKSSGGIEKATGEMMKSMQKIPVAGALFN